MENKKIIIGRNPVFEYLKHTSKGAALELAISKKAHGKIIEKIISEAKRKEIKLSFREKNYFDRIESSSKHQGVILHLGTSAPSLSEADLLTKIADEKGVLVVLDQLTDPHNVGSIIRSAEALGASGVALTKAHTSGINNTVIKSSAGATAHISILQISNLSTFLSKAKEHDFWILGADDSGTETINEFIPPRPLIIIIGNEGTGMRRLTHEKCDYLVKIPLKGNISSLNASVAAGIVLYEILK